MGRGVLEGHGLPQLLQEGLGTRKKNATKRALQKPISPSAKFSGPSEAIATAHRTPSAKVPRRIPVSRPTVEPPPRTTLPCQLRRPYGVEVESSDLFSSGEGEPFSRWRRQSIVPTATPRPQVPDPCTATGTACSKYPSGRAVPDAFPFRAPAPCASQ